jgi:hypothetical protein
MFHTTPPFPGHPPRPTRKSILFVLDGTQRAPKNSGSATAQAPDSGGGPRAPRRLWVAPPPPFFRNSAYFARAVDTPLRRVKSCVFRSNTHMPLAYTRTVNALQLELSLASVCSTRIATQEHRKDDQMSREDTAICGTRNRRGLPCQCKLLLKGGRCKFHGGMSTGPKTAEGKARAVEAMRAGLERWRMQRTA